MTQVLDKGFVELVDSMGGDASIVQAARVSYGAGTKTPGTDTQLIRFLMRHRHTTPFEMVEFKFRVMVPMDCWRQWIRHRTANVNEYSTRYSEAIDECQETAVGEWRTQSGTNKQGSGEFLTEWPLSNYTIAYWKIDLHNLFHFLSLRMDSHAQYEIRQYANAIYELIEPIVPIACQAFSDYRLAAMYLTATEVHQLQGFFKYVEEMEGLVSLYDKHWDSKEITEHWTKREQNEFRAKLSRLV